MKFNSLQQKNSGNLQAKINRLVIKDSILASLHPQSYKPLNDNMQAPSENEADHPAFKLCPKMTYGSIKNSKQLVNDYANQTLAEADHLS